VSFPLFLDEHEDERLATQLTTGGQDVLTTKGAGRHNQALSDEDQLAFAAGQKRAMVTHNVADFKVLYQQWWEAGKHHSGIIVVSPWKVTAEIYAAILQYQRDYPDGIDDLILFI